MKKQKHKTPIKLKSRPRYSSHKKKSGVKIRPGKAFTLVEFIVVFVIIAILMSITSVAYMNIQRKANSALLRTDLDSVLKQLNMFEAENGSYPTTIDCTLPDSSTNKCVKASNGVVHEYIMQSASEALFCLASEKNEYRYNIDQSGDVMAGPCPIVNLVASNSVSYNGVGNTWYDVSGNENNSNLSGVTYSVVNGGVFSFDGVNDYVSSDGVDGIDSDLISVSTWIRPGSVNGTYEISNQGEWTTGSWVGWRFKQIGGSVNFSISDGTANNYECSGGDFSSVAWHYVVGVWDGQQIIIYIDGKQEASCSEFVEYHGNSGSHSIGKFAGSPYYFNGYIGSISVYDEALNPYEVQENFDITKSQYGL